jgi:trehalose 6-phosphate phosphatase
MEWAWFFDVDGTLVELAPTPSSVVVHGDLTPAIALLHDLSGGAVSIITGRSISDVESLLDLPDVAVSGQHGLELRSADGTLTSRKVRIVPLRMIAQELKNVAGMHPGLIVEEKGMSIALHYRLAPRSASYAHSLMKALKEKYAPEFVIQKGKRVVELKPAGTDKGIVIRQLMESAPFNGRIPVFVGDDVTDEAGFRVVNEMNGYSIKVGAGPTAARYRIPGVTKLREWLVSGMTEFVPPNMCEESE